MVFKAVQPEIKDKVISAHLTGQGRNQIVRELAKQGIQVSAGSVSNICSQYKSKHLETSQPQPLSTDSPANTVVNIPSTTTTDNATISTTGGINQSSSEPPISKQENLESGVGHERAAIISNSASITPRSEIDTRNSEPNIDFSTMSYPGFVSKYLQIESIIRV